MNGPKVHDQGLRRSRWRGCSEEVKADYQRTRDIRQLRLPLTLSSGLALHMDQAISKKNGTNQPSSGAGFDCETGEFIVYHQK